MALLSTGKIAEIQKVVDLYVVRERARLIRAEKDALDRRRKSQEEAFSLLDHARGPLALATLLNGMTDFRALATVHVRRMIAEGKLHASDAIEGDHDERAVLIRLA